MFFDAIITYSLRNKLVIGLMILCLVFWGARSYTQLAIDAVPDITNNQVQVITQSPSLAALEVEQLITAPLEFNLANLPKVDEIRSISRFGLSVITVVFHEDADLLQCRQLVADQVKKAEADLDPKLAKPELGPISTGLGEIYQYTIEVTDDYKPFYDLTQLRTLQDWVIKRGMAGVPGVIEVSSFGGFVKEYEVSIHPARLEANGTTIDEVMAAIDANNSNTGGSYIEKADQVYFIRGEGMIKSLDELKKVVIKQVNGVPLLMEHVSNVKYGHPNRNGAMTADGKGEAVGGIVMMLKGSNSAAVIKEVKERMATIQKSMPPGVKIVPFLDRSKLVESSISTVATNLIEGGLIVIFVLVFLLGNLRAGLVVASVIPLSMLFAIGMMNWLGISANLMSLGAIDFGLIVDGAVIIVESIYHHLILRYGGIKQRISQTDLDQVVHDSALKIRKSASFGELIILMVYLPILALVGVEGKMFKPMAETVIFAILGALILSLTWVPVAASLFLPRRFSDKPTLADRLILKLQNIYRPALKWSIRKGWVIVAVALVLFAFSAYQLTQLGGEFMPELDEGDYAVETRLLPGSSLTSTVEATLKAEKLLLKHPEVLRVIGKIGTSEIPTDPMPLESADLIVMLKPRAQWPDPRKQKSELTEELTNSLHVIAGVAFDFQQPIQMRFNELMTGVKSDVAIKLFGDDLTILYNKANEISGAISKINGISQVKVEAIGAVPQMQVKLRRDQLAAYGLTVQHVNQTIQTAFAGAYQGKVYEGERRYDLVIRMDSLARVTTSSLANLLVKLPSGGIIPLSSVATVELKAAPMQVSRDNTRRRIVVGVSVEGRDMASVVSDVKTAIDKKVKLPTGYYLTYGGQFQNYERAKDRLMIAVPLALLLIFMLLFVTFNSVKQAALIFSAVPLSAIGGIWALWLRDMPFSISAGVGFIALFGVAVLNGIVLIGQFNLLQKEGSSLNRALLFGALERLRPVLLTAAVASLGFIPMAVSTSGGAEVQRPLATVVIGGLVTSTILTLLVLPVLYRLVSVSKQLKPANLITAVLLALLPLATIAQQPASKPITLKQAFEQAGKTSPDVAISMLELDRFTALQRTAYDLGKTSFDVQYGNTQVPYLTDYTLMVGQTLSLPQVYGAQKQALSAQTKLTAAQKEHSHALAILQIRNLFARYLATGRKQHIINQQINQLVEVSRIASSKAQQGESIKLEALTAQSRLGELRLSETGLKQQNLAVERELGYLLFARDTALVPDTAGLFNQQFFKFDRPNEGHELFQIAQEQINVASAVTNVEAKRFLPDLKLGYAYQSIERVQGQQFVTVGVNIPIFNRANFARLQAGKIQQRIANEQREQIVARLNKEYVVALKQHEVLIKQLDWYSKTALTEAQELISVGNKAYRAGELDYSQYILSSQQAWSIRQAFLDTWLNYQLNMNNLLYLATE